jgi:RHS repeat-associated protein
MKCLITLAFLLTLPVRHCLATVEVWNKADDGNGRVITLVGRIDYTGTKNGTNTSGTYYVTNTITVNSLGSYADAKSAGFVDSLTYGHTMFPYLNGAAWTNGQPTGQTGYYLGQAGALTTECVLYGANWDLPALPGTYQRMDIISIVGTKQFGATRADSPACGGLCQGQAPMAAYKFHSLLASLSIWDSPVSYSPPRGQPITFVATYNQKEAFQPTNWTISNFGPRWNLNMISYVQDDVTNPTNDVVCFPQGGGSENYTGYNPSTSTFALQVLSQTSLKRNVDGTYNRGFPDGSIEVYSYADAGTSNRRVFLTQSLDAHSNQVSYVYATDAGTVRLSQVLDALGQTNTVAYDLPADSTKITSITDPFGRTAYFGYSQTNGALRLTSITDPVGIVSQLTYGTNDFITALTTPYGTTAFSYAESVGVATLTATDPYGQTECVQYMDNAVVQPESAFPSGVLLDTNRTVARDTFYWSKKAWATGPNDPTKAELTHWALQGGQVVEIPLYIKMPAEGGVWFNYPGQTNANGEGATTATPAAMARRLDDGTTQLTSLRYDQFGHLTNSVDAVGRATTFSYSTNGVDLLAIYQINGAGRDTLASLTYNQHHLPISSAISGVSNRMDYNAGGQLLHITNALNQVTTFNYASSGYLTNITGQSPGDRFDLTYDIAGRIRSMTDSDGYAITNLYDAIDRLTNATFPDATTLQYVYERLEASKARGRDNRWTYFTYNSNQKLSSIQDSAGRLFHYEWCGCGALDSITDPKGQSTAWIRDIESRPTQKLYADNSSDALTYETATSRLKQATDSAGKSINLLYNKDDTAQQIAYSGGPATPSVSFAWDPYYNRLTSMVDGIGTNALTYVLAGQPWAGSLQSIDGPLPNDTITFGYDPLGRPLTVQIGGATSAVQYDQVGRVWWSSNMVGVTTVQYVGATTRPALISRPNGLSTTFGYTPVSDGSRLQDMLTTNGAAQVIERYDYAYDIRDLLLWQTNLVGGTTTVWNYSYDSARQLTGAIQWTNGAAAHRYSYGYDKAGNRLSEQIDAAAASETPNNLNQITSRTGGGAVRVAGYLSETGTVAIAGSPARMLTTTNFTGMLNVGTGTNTFSVSAADISGNSITNWYNLTISANGLPTSFVYDPAGNLLTKSNASQVLSFGWDGADRCTAITNGSLRTALAYDGLGRWAKIQEYSGASLTADRRFVWNGTSPAEERDSTGTTVVKRFYANGFWQQGTNYYYLTDQIGSVREVTLANGTVVARFEYDPWGRRTQTFGTLWVDFGFAGLFELPNGLKLAVWRVYDPNTGRWNSRDLIKENGGWNLYAYCRGNPINYVDTTGFADKEVLKDNDPFKNAVHQFNPTDFVTVAAHGDERDVFSANPFKTPEKQFVPNSVIDPSVDPGRTGPSNRRNAAWLVAQIKDALDAKPHAPILLIVCGGGYGGQKSLAAQIHKLTGRDVIATDTWVKAKGGVVFPNATPDVNKALPENNRQWLIFNDEHSAGSPIPKLPTH